MQSVRFNLIHLRKLLSINDSLLLSKMIETLGTFVYCCGSDYRGQKISKELLDLLWVLSQLRDNVKIKNEEKDVITIRRSVLHTMLRVFVCLSKEILVEEYGHTLKDYITWLTQVIQNDSDQNCKEMAAAILSILQQCISYQ